MTTSGKLFIGLVLAVVAIGVGVLLVTKDTPPAPQEAMQNEENTTADTSTSDAADGKKMAFSEFMKQDGSYVCTVHQYVADQDTTGTTYIHDGMIRGEYDVRAQGIALTAHVIVRDGFAHTWTSMMPGVGYKSPVVDSTASADASVGTSGTYAWNADQIGDYNCEAWAPDASYFELPSGTVFTEVGA